MNYKNNMAFAIRTILMEKELRKLYPDYDFTIAAGAVLNALSAIKPDDVLFVKPTTVLDATTEQEVKEVLTILRDGLAHKIELNFKPEPDDKNQIASIDIAHKWGNNKRTLSITDFHKVLEVLEQAIEESNDYKELYKEEKAKWDNNRNKAKP